MKRRLTLLALSLCWTQPMWADTNAPPKPAAAVEAVTTASPYAAGKFSVSPYTGWNVSDSELNSLDGRQFVGLQAEYMAVNNVGIEIEAAADDTDERFIDQFGMHFRGYLPLGKPKRFAPFGELGWQRFTHRDGEEDAMSVGAGLSLRSENVGFQFGARWVRGFRDQDEGTAQLWGALNFLF